MGGHVGAHTGLYSSFGHMMKAFVGANYLSIPYAIKCAGLYLGVVGLVVVGVLTGYCCLLLIECKRALETRYRREGEGSEVRFELLSEGVGASKETERVTYGDIAAHVYGSRGRMVVEAALVVTQLGFCVGYFIFVSSNLATLASAYFSAQISPWVFVLLLLPGVISLALIQDISRLVPFSLVADGVLLFGFVVILSRVLDQIRYAPPPPGDVVLVNWSTFALFFGVVVSGFEGIALVVPMESSMGLPPVTFRRMLVLCIVSVTAIFGVFGALGYVAFGSSVLDLLTLNLEASPLLNLVTLCVCLGIVFTYPLQLFPAVDIITSSWFKSSSTHLRKRISIILVLATAATAFCIPRFGLLLSLIGNMGSATLSFILPALLHLNFFDNPNIPSTTTQLHYAIVLFGLVGGGIGTLVSLHEIWIDLSGQGAAHVHV